MASTTDTNQTHQNMKKYVLLSCLLSASTCITAHATEAPSREVLIDDDRFGQLSEADRAAVMDLKDRMERFLATDRSTLSPDERRALKAEWKDMKHEMDELNRRDGTVIYLSSAGIIIIILLLIILL